jgi:hypothetical protein
MLCDQGGVEVDAEGLLGARRIDVARGGVGAEERQRVLEQVEAVDGRLRSHLAGGVDEPLGAPEGLGTLPTR